MEQQPVFENARCPNCSRSVGSHKIQMYTSICGHDLCLECLEEKYKYRGTNKCGWPGCGEELTRHNYAAKLFESSKVHREVYVRKHLLRSYNNTLDSYNGDLNAYNNYLEMVEDLAYNLTYNKDDPQIAKACMDQIKNYETENGRMIQANEQQLELEKRQGEIKRREEKKKKLRLLEERRRNLNTDSTKEKREKIKKDILSGELDARQGMEALKALRKKAEEMQTPMELVESAQEEPEIQDSLVVNLGATVMKTEKFAYERVLLDRKGPMVPQTPALQKMLPTKDTDMLSSLSTDIMAVGGYDPSVTAKRAMMDAFDSLFLSR